MRPTHRSQNGHEDPKSHHGRDRIDQKLKPNIIGECGCHDPRTHDNGNQCAGAEEFGEVLSTLHLAAGSGAAAGVAHANLAVTADFDILSHYSSY